MPGLTDSQFLPYQLGTDLRCDAPETWEAFLTQFEARYLPLANLAARLDNVPMAVIERRTAWDFATMGGSSGLVQFDTVLIDTDGMVDLDADNLSITPQRNGWYIGYGFIRSLKTQIGTADIGLSLSGGYAANLTAHDVDDGLSWFDVVGVMPFAYQSTDIFTSTGKPWFPDEAGAALPAPWQLFKSGDNSISYDFAQMGVFWIADV